MVRQVVTGDSLTRRLKRSLCCLLIEVPWQINEYLNLDKHDVGDTYEQYV